MATDLTVEADRFGSALSDILAGLDTACAATIKPAVTKGAKVCKADWSANAPRLTGDYAGSISYKVLGTGREVHAVVGSKTKPGLAHLLEKGHAKTGGGRVPAQPHIAPAADLAFDATYAAFEEAIGSALGDLS